MALGITAAAKLGGVDQPGSGGIELGDESAPSGAANHVGVAVGVYGDPGAKAAAVEIGGVDEGRAAGIDLCHKGNARVVAVATDGLEGVRRCRESVRPSPARHVSVAGGVHGDPVARVIRLAAKVAGVHEGGTDGIELRNERINPAAGHGLEGPRRRRKILAEPVRGGHAARHVGIAVGIHSDVRGDARKWISASKVGGIDQGGAGGIQLCDEEQAVGLRRPRSRREVRRGRRARHVGVAGGVHGDRVTVVIAGTAKVGGVREHRIDDEGPAAIVRGQLEADPLGAFEDIAAFDLCPDAVDQLVNDGFVLAYVALCRMQHEVALRVDLEFLRAREAEHDLLRVRSGRDDEVVLELPLVAVIDEIDPAIDLAVMHLGIGRHIGAPSRRILADEVVRLAGEFVAPAHKWLARRTHEAHAEHGRIRLNPPVGTRLRAAHVAFRVRARLREDEDRLAGGEIKIVAGTARKEAHVLMRLAAVRLELERQLAVALAHPSVRRRADW